MIGTRRFGRLGNELWQYAAVIGYATKHGLEYSLPSITNDKIWNPVHMARLKHPNWIEGREDVLLNEVWNREQHYVDIPFDESWRDKQIVLNGYWQSHLYVDPYRDEIIKAFNYPYEFNEGVCSIHVRRGDYLLYPRLHPVVTEDYLFGAICESKMKSFLVHSDDIGWCKESFKKYDGLKFEYSEGKTPEQDLVSMANCEHQICSNSSLALWGAELNQNPNKIVIVPSESNWFGIDNQVKMTVKDMFRPEWIQIKYQA